MRWVSKGIQIYVISAVFTSATTTIVPILFSWGKSLPFMAWFPYDYPYGYEVVLRQKFHKDYSANLIQLQIFYVIQVFFVINLASTGVGSDTVFGACCGMLIAQFKLLNRKLKNTKHAETNKEFVLNIQECIRYHLKLIEQSSTQFNFKQFVYILLQIWTNVGKYLFCFLPRSVCYDCDGNLRGTLHGVGEVCTKLCVSKPTHLHFYAFLSMSSFSQIARFVSYMSTIMLQMGMFCFLAEAVMDEVKTKQNTHEP